MPDCPRCHQSVEAQAIACPHCGTTLKAYGHPGITLYRATTGESLCQSCTYHDDDSCTFPQRPQARECTMYHNHLQPLTFRKSATMHPTMNLNTWFRQHGAWIILVGVIVVSIGLALSGR